MGEVMDIARADQHDAACAEVRAMVARSPSLGRHRDDVPDTRGHDALKARLVAELKLGSIQHCCGLTRNPRPLFWIPRHKILLCETHWGMAHLCGCFEECDFCGFSISEGTLVMVFFDHYIVQAVICKVCDEHVRLCPSGVDT